MSGKNIDLLDYVNATNKNDIENNKTLIEQLLFYAIDFVGEIWKTAEIKDITLQKFESGLVNTLILCSLNINKNTCKEPTKLVFRFSRKPQSEIIIETVISSILAEQKLGPKLYGVLNNGRVEEYIPSRCLKFSELSILPIAKEIARQLAQIHQLEIPIKKKAGFMDFIDQTYNNLIKHPKCPEGFHPSKQYQKYAPKTFSIKELKNEIEFVRLKFVNLGEKNIVFCHNDVHGGNILFHHEDNPESNKMESFHKPKKVCIIDFEFASYNPRGFDLANHFAEYIYDYDADSPPFTKPENLPTKEHMLEFLKAYIEQQQKQSNLTESQVLEEANELLKETLPFMPISHIYWGCYVMNHCLNNPSSWNALGFVNDAFGAYFMQKYLLNEI